MANKVGYIIQLQDRFSRAAKKINSQMRGIDKNANKAAKTINKKLTRSFSNLGNIAKNALGGVIAAFSIREFLTRGAAFQDAIADLSSITGEAGESLKFLTDESLRLAKVSNIAQVDVVNAFTAIASAKSELLKDPKGLSVVTEQALLLANAAGISVPDAVRASVGALNQFEAGADQAARFVNVLAAGAKVGASQVGETAEALKNAGTVAAKLGLSFESTNAILQVFAKSEIKGAEAGTKLRGTLIQLEKLGGRFAPSVVGIDEALKNLAQTQFTNTDLIRDFGNENLTTALILRANVPLIRRWTKELTNTNVAQKQADVRLATFSAKMRGLGITINDVIIKTFLRLEPVISKQIEKMAEFFDTIKPERVDALAESLLAAAKAIGIIGKGLGFIAKGFEFVGTEIGEDIAKLNLILSGEGRLVSNLQALELEAIRGGSISTLERQRGATAGNLNTAPMRSQTDVNVNLRAPERTVESIKTRTSGKSPGLNVGVNMETAG